MSADLLREAADMMRKRADAASPSPWHYEAHSETIWAETPGGEHPWVGVANQFDVDADPHHIASWHPQVALAVADLLDKDADLCRLIGDGWQPNEMALAVARAYLGRAS